MSAWISVNRLSCGRGFSPADLFKFEVTSELAAFARLPEEEEDASLAGDDEEAE